MLRYVMLLELCTPLTYLWLSLSAFLLLSCLDLFPSQNYPCGRPNKGEAIQRLISPRSTRGYTIKTQEKKRFYEQRQILSKFDSYGRFTRPWFSNWIIGWMLGGGWGRGAVASISKAYLKFKVNPGLFWKKCIPSWHQALFRLTLL